MAPRPNLLLICTDEQRPDTLACYGNAQIDVPHLNRLAARSVVVESAYCTQPWCTPSRSSLLTGLYPHATGCTSNHLPLRADVLTIAELLADDYVCAYIGKWHLGDEVVPQRGFTHWRTYQDHAFRELYSRPEYLGMLSGYHHFLVARGYAPTVESAGALVFTQADMVRMPEPHTIAGYVAHETVEFVEHAPRDRPWMAQVHFHEPHPPFHSPYNAWHDSSTFRPGPAFRQVPGDDGALVNRVVAEETLHSSRDGCDLSTEAGWRELVGRYWGLMKLVDNQVGRILEALDRTGQADHTIVVLTSDHGEMLGDHGQLGKHVQYEESVRIPLLFYDPRLARTGRPLPGRFSHVDLVPTLLDLLGAPIPDGLHGISRAAAIRGDAALDGDVFIEWQDSHLNLPLRLTVAPEVLAVAAAPRRTIVTQDGWKLNLYEADDHELFDLATDPHELRNVIGDPANAARTRDLRARIARWQHRVADTVELPPL
jgi:arylsulfatase A-like enzyme